jgi:hypothetical protein
MSARDDGAWEKGTCGNCAWSERMPGPNVWGQIMQCRLHPPHPDHGWPMTREDEWCGDWQYYAEDLSWHGPGRYRRGIEKAQTGLEPPPE